MRVLIVEDDRELRGSLSQALQLAGYEVDALGDGAMADSALRVRDRYALVVLDLGLPRQEGLSVLRALRDRRDATPVLILTAMDAVESKVQALDAGADDYLVKPFSIAELEARLRVLVRRKFNQPDTTLSCGALQLDVASRVVVGRGGERLEFSSKEIALLELLLRRAPNWVAKQTLVDQLGSWDAEISPNAVEVAIHRLRKRLQPSGVEIVTVRGLGYLLQEASP
jgi:two-component system, OmpR family, response regulator